MRDVRRLMLTASGGPFRGWSPTARDGDEDDALAHPTWPMGPKITIDSSTLMNKGLEVLEASALFGVERRPRRRRRAPPVHRALDGRARGRLDARPAVAPRHATAHRLRLGYPIASTTAGAARLRRAAQLTFEPPDLDAFPALALAYEAARRGGTAPAWLNAANEVAVEAFLAERLAWNDIVPLVAAVMDDYVDDPLTSLDSLTANDAHARRRARDLVAKCPVDCSYGHGCLPVQPAQPGQTPGGRRRGHRAARLVGRLGVARRGLRDHRDGHGARVRPLHHRQARGHEGDRVLRRLRPRRVVDDARRDALRRARDPGRGLRQGARDDLDREDRPGRRGAHLPRGDVPAQGPVRLGGFAHARRDGRRAGVGVADVLRAPVGQPPGRRGIHPLGRPHPQRGPTRRTARGRPRPFRRRPVHHLGHLADQRDPRRRRTAR